MRDDSEFATINVTGVTTIGGVNYYMGNSQEFDSATNTYQDAPSPYQFDYSLGGWLLEENNTLLSEFPVFVWAKYRGVDPATGNFIFEFNAPPLDLTVDLTGGTPSYPNIDLIDFDNTQFSISQTTAGQVAVSLVPFTCDVVSTALNSCTTITQEFLTSICAQSGLLTQDADSGVVSFTPVGGSGMAIGATGIQVIAVVPGAVPLLLQQSQALTLPSTIVGLTSEPVCTDATTTLCCIVEPETPCACTGLGLSWDAYPAQIQVNFAGLTNYPPGPGGQCNNCDTYWCETPFILDWVGTPCEGAVADCCYWAATGTAPCQDGDLAWSIVLFTPCNDGGPYTGNCDPLATILGLTINIPYPYDIYLTQYWIYNPTVYNPFDTMTLNYNAPPSSTLWTPCQSASSTVTVQPYYG